MEVQDKDCEENGLFLIVETQRNNLVGAIGGPINADELPCTERPVRPVAPPGKGGTFGACQ